MILRLIKILLRCDTQEGKKRRSGVIRFERGAEFTLDMMVQGMLNRLVFYIPFIIRINGVSSRL